MTKIEEMQKKLTIEVEESCGPLTIQYRIEDYRQYGEERVKIEWYVCPDDEDKNHERAHCAGEVDGKPEDFDDIAVGAIEACRDAVAGLANNLLAWSQQQVHRIALQASDEVSK